LPKEIETHPFKGKPMTKKSNAASTKKSASTKPTPKSAPSGKHDFDQTAVAMRLKRKSSDHMPTPEHPPSGKPAVVYDYPGYVLFSLPSTLKETLGEAVFNKCLADLEDLEVTAIHREADTVSYVHMACFAQMVEMPKTPKSSKTPKKAGSKRAA
jgi:hypothetical protein